jgi:hypothetical protein
MLGVTYKRASIFCSLGRTGCEISLTRSMGLPGQTFSQCYCSARTFLTVDDGFSLQRNSVS